MVKRVSERWVWTKPFRLSTSVLLGSFGVDIPKAAEYMAVMNGSGAQIAVSIGTTYTQPQDAIIVQPFVYMGFPISKTQKMTVHWTASNGLLSSEAESGVFIFSNEPIIVSGGPVTTGGVASNVTVQNSPTVNINTMPNVTVGSLPSVTSIDGGFVSLGAKTDAPVTDPTSSGSLIALIKGVIKQLQGSGGGAIPISPVGSSSLTAAISVVAAAGSRIALPSIACREVTITALRTNTGYIYVGGVDVSSTVYGVDLAGKESITLLVSNANKVYIDASVSGEGVSYVTI